MLKYQIATRCCAPSAQQAQYKALHLMKMLPQPYEEGMFSQFSFSDEDSEVQRG